MKGIQQITISSKKVTLFIIQENQIQHHTDLSIDTLSMKEALFHLYIHASYYKLTLTLLTLHGTLVVMLGIDIFMITARKVCVTIEYL